MKLDMPLDYALFQLDSARTRCELWISAGGVTEKLASGLLKSFLGHLNAAQEQISSGAQCIRLQAPSVTADGRNSGAAWFSKGTMDRFVRFVSIPEVLERVSAVEAESHRLEEAISILANESGNEHHLFNPTLVPSDGKTAEKGADLKKLKYEHQDPVEIAGDTSKRQLLRAMDGRRVMLQKEQRKALAQAVAAGFNIDCMSDLVVFADCFGATQLREACLKFMALRKKIQGYDSLIDEMELAAETVSTGLKMSRSGIIIHKTANSEDDMVGLSHKLSNDQRDNGSSSYDAGEKLVIASSDRHIPGKFGMGKDREIKRRSVSKLNSSGLQDSLKRQVVESPVHSTVKNHVRMAPMDKLEGDPKPPENCEHGIKSSKIDCLTSEYSKNHDAVESSPKADAKSSTREMDEVDSAYETSSVAGKNSPSYGISTKLNDTTTRRTQRSASPMRRSASPLRKVQIARSAVRRQGAFLMRSFGQLSVNSKELVTKKQDEYGPEETESHENTESKSDSDEEKRSVRSSPKHLSVQDAISLFERKKEPLDLLVPKGTGRSDDHKDNEENGIQTVPGKDAPKEWSSNENGLGRKPFQSDDIEKNVEDYSSVEDIVSNNLEIGDAGEKLQAKISERDIKSLAKPACCNGAGLPILGKNKKEQNLPSKLEHKAPLQLRSAVTRSEKPLPNSQMQTLHVISTLPEIERAVARRHTLPTTEFDADSNKQRVKLDAVTSVAKNSLSKIDLLVKRPSVKGLGLTEKTSRIEKKKPKKQELSLQNNTTVYRQISAVEVASQQNEAAANYRQTQIASPEILASEHMHSEQKGTAMNTPQRPIHCGRKERLNLNEERVLAVDDLSEKNTGKGTSRKSWSTPSDFHLEALAKMSASNDNEDEKCDLNAAGSADKDLKGRLYEQYRQKRDAKLRLDSGSKRAEREAKMKAMQEALERRKVELSTRNNKPKERDNVAAIDPVQSEKIKALKVGVLKSKTEKEGRKKLSEESKVQHQSSFSHENQSASSTPRIVSSMNSRPSLAKKTSPSSQKSSSAMPSHGGTKTVRASPNSDAINSKYIGTHSSQRRGLSGSRAKTAVNVLSHSATSHVEMRKESMKLSSGHNMKSCRQEKGNSVKCIPKVAHQANISVPHNVSVDFNEKSSAMPETQVQTCESSIESQKCLSLCEQFQVRENSPLAEFIDKGNQLDPSSRVVETERKSNELRAESEPDEVMQESHVPPEENISSSSLNMMPIKQEDSDDFEGDSPPFVNENRLSKHFEPNIGRSLLSEETRHSFEVASEEVSASYSGETLFAPGGSRMKDNQEITTDTVQSSWNIFGHQHVRLPIARSSFVEARQNPPLPTLYTLHSEEMFQHPEMDAYESRTAQSFSPSSRALQLHDTLNSEDRDSFLWSPSVSSFHASQSPRSISRDHLGSLTIPRSSLFPRTTSRNYSSAHPSLSAPTTTLVKHDPAQSGKLRNIPQKPIMLPSQLTQKETSKGFKRLLKFGRKSRISEPSVQDWIAASTSEGDEDADESKDYAGDDLRASRNGSKYSYKFTDSPPKIPDFDVVQGPGPRSFFSLSPFKSKSNEVKLRSQ